MNETVTLKHKGQIHVILDQENKNIQGQDNFGEHFFIKESERQKHDPLASIEQEMETLIGMKEIKKLVKEIYAWLYINKCRQAQGLKVEKQVLHMLFKGNPGTGKTTVARLLGKLFQQMHVLEKGHLIEADRSDLVGEYIGQTAQKTKDLVKKADEGILFVDEAYALARGGEKDFGKEAIDCLVKAMEDGQHNFMLILAGYSREMERFLAVNPGLPSRFPIQISFPNYKAEDLVKISEKMTADREYILTNGAKQEIRQHLQMNQGPNFSNGRYVRNLIEKAIRNQSVRLLREGNHERERLITLQDDDFELVK